MTRDEFVKRLKASNVPSDKWQTALNDRRREIGLFDDETDQAATTKPAVQPEKKPWEKPYLQNMADQAKKGLSAPITESIKAGKNIGKGFSDIFAPTDPGTPGWSQRVSRGVAAVGDIIPQGLNALIGGFALSPLSRSASALSGGQTDRLAEGATNKILSAEFKPSTYWNTMAAMDGADIENISDQNKPSTSISKVISPLVQASQSDDAKGANLRTLGRYTDIGLTMLPIFKGKNIYESATKNIGEKAVVPFGLKAKQSELKMTKGIAEKSYGKTLDDKEKTIVKDIYDFGVTQGDNSAAKLDALSKAQMRLDKADEISSTVANDPNGPKFNANLAFDGIDPKKIANVNKRDVAMGTIQKIQQGWIEDGLTGELTLDKLIQMKKSLNNEGDLFSKGLSSTDDILSKNIRKKMYYNIIDAIGEKVPQIKAMNTEAKRLLDIHAALDAADRRVAHNDVVGLTDFIVGAEMLAHPGSLVFGVPAMMAKKASQNGAFGNSVLNLGRMMTGDKPKTIEQTLSNTPVWSPQTFSPLITDPKRLLPYQMVGKMQSIENMEIPIGAKIRNMGKMPPEPPPMQLTDRTTELYRTPPRTYSPEPPIQENRIVNLDRSGKRYPAISEKIPLPDNPALDQDFQISKIINSLKSGRSPQEVDDLLKNLSSQLPFGNPNRQQPYMLSEDLMNKLRNFKNRRILEDLQ